MSRPAISKSMGPPLTLPLSEPWQSWPTPAKQAFLARLLEKQAEQAQQAQNKSKSASDLLIEKGIQPMPGPQTRFLETRADIAIYGGAAGGGKTYGLLIDPLRHIDNPRFGAVIFRRSFPQITVEGGLWDEAVGLYPSLEAIPNKSTVSWHFPTGATIAFAHLGPGEEIKYQGAQIAMMGFDQLEHWPESQVFYMLSRNRSMCGVKPYIRATCNPDADSWIAKFIAWWIDPDTGYPIDERGGVLRWFVRVGGVIEWADSPDELQAKYPGREFRPKSVTFIPAKVYDNSILLMRNPDYLANLMALPPVEQERLLNGNWKIRPEAGKIFNRAWCEVVEAIPTGGVMCRFWDFAGTERKSRKTDPDFTAGVRMRKVGGEFFVDDCVAAQASPSDVDDLLANTTGQDLNAARQVGAHYMVRWEIEPGSAGLREAARLVKLLAGHDAFGVPPRGDKFLRGKPFVIQAKAGNVKVLAADWTEGWLNHMHNQPEIAHDDIWDASVGAFLALVVPASLRENEESDSDGTPAAGAERYTRKVGGMRGRL